MPRSLEPPAAGGGAHESREVQFEAETPKRLSFRLFLVWSVPAFFLFSLLPALYILFYRLANEAAGGAGGPPHGGPPSRKGGEDGGPLLVVEEGTGDLAPRPQTLNRGCAVERQLGFKSQCCPDHWSTASCPVVNACKDSPKSARALSLLFPHAQQGGAFEGPLQQQLSPAVGGDCSMLLVREEGPLRGPPAGGALAGFWHKVSRPQGGEGGVWGAPLFVSDGGLLLRREFDGVWKVFSAAFGGAVVAYVAAKQPFPTGSKWWVQQQQQQQQQQQWKLEKRLRAECIGGGGPRSGGPPFSPRDIFFGLPAAAVTACRPVNPQKEGGSSLTMGPPFSGGPYGGPHKALHGGPQGAPYSYSQLLCAHLMLQPQGADALQQSLLAAAERLFNGRGEQQQHQQQQQQQQEQQERFRCRRLVISGGVGLGGLGCTGRFLLHKPSDKFSLYFSLSLDARVTHLSIEKGFAVCGAQGALPVAAGVYAHSDSSANSNSSSSSSGSSRREGGASLEQQEELVDLQSLLFKKNEVELKGLWMQEGGSYAAAPMHLKCMDTTASATAVARGCNVLRVRGFASAALNGIWRLSGRLNERPSFLKYTNWIDLAVAAAVLEARPAAAAAATKSTVAAAAAAAAAGRAVLHLYYEEALGLWVIAPNLPPAADAAAASPAAAAAAAAAAAVERDKDAGVPTAAAAAAADTEGAATTAAAAIGFEGKQKIIAFSRSAAVEPPAGLWSVFGERERRNTREKKAAEGNLVEINLVQIRCLSNTGP
ncbi:hypothetical protein Emag_001381 [Eimeria magna]